MNTKAKLLDIAMNLNRVGNWAADDYVMKQKRISFFLDQTSDYLTDIQTRNLPLAVKGIFIRFTKEYPNLKEEGKIGPKDNLYWAERMMTWGNILTHRSQLIK